MAFLPIGFIGKPHGLKGHLKISLNPPFVSSLQNTEALFILEQGRYLPYFIHQLDFDKEGNGLVLFEDFKSPEQAREIANRDIYLEKDSISKSLIQSLDQDLQLIGYAVISKQTNSETPVGTIVSITKNGGQNLATIEDDQKQILIPLEESWIESVDHQQQIIHMRLPEGLVNLND